MERTLAFTWKISRGESTKKTLHFIKVSHGNHSGIGEVAGITADPVKAEQLLEQFHDFAKMGRENLDEILGTDLPSHLKFGITSALTHLKAAQAGQTLAQYLGVTPKKKIATSFSLPILPLQDISSFFKERNLQNFSVLKLKISQDQAVESCLELARLFKGPLRIDANEAFETHTQVLSFLDQVKELNIQFVEQPLPRTDVIESKKLKEKSPFPIFADESVQEELFDASLLERFHGINVKLMKAGSYQQAIQQIKKAKALEMQVMLGCMVESSLAIAGAMAISEDVDYFDLDGFLYFEEEPHKLVTENKGLLTYRQDHPLFTNL